MKPKNKFQAKVFALSQKLPNITQTQIDWTKVNCFEHIARVTKKGQVSCMECGKSWEDKSIVPPTALYNDLLTETTVCPHCNATLTIKQTRQRVFNQIEYLCVPTTSNGYQVLRFIYFTQTLRVGKKAHYFCSEVVQRWIAPNGKYATLARLRPMGYWVDSWLFHTDLEIRPEKPLYDILPSAVYPRMKVLSNIKRNGFKGQFHSLTPFEMFHTLATNNRAETLLKAGQTNLLKFFVRNGSRDIDTYWQSIKIAIRNGYNVKDGSIWCDYINLLQHFGKDTNSSKYVCPIDLMEEHDRLMKRKEEQDKRRELKEKRAKAIADEQNFKELKAKFFGLIFSDGGLQVRVLDSVIDYIEEGTAMHHCVESYHNRENSLVFSATINGERIATIEISLDTLKVVQCRGLCNKQVAEQKQITNLINRNLHQIENRLTA